MELKKAATMRCMRRYAILLFLVALGAAFLMFRLRSTTNSAESADNSVSYLDVSRRISSRDKAKQNGVSKATNITKVYRDQREAVLVTGITEPPNLPKDGVSDVEEDMRLRRARVAAVCDANPLLKDMYTNNSIVSKKHGFLYCPVPKVASTFWSRFFYQLVYTEPMGSPFDVPVPSVIPKYFFKFKLQENTEDTFAQALRDLKRLVYVRDPYSRLYSAYVDKVIAPNPYHWKSWGKPAVAKYRKSAESKCGHDASFAEYMALTVDSLWTRDVHMQPVYHYCPPCLLDFNVIGKMETFTRDAMKLASMLNVSEKQIGFHRMEKDAVDDAIYDSAKDSMSDGWLKMTLVCISRDDVLRRILRKLQLRGIVSWRFRYPFSKQEAKYVTLDQYVDVLHKGREQYLNKTELKIQKRQAYLEAYHSVPQNVLKKLDEIYRLDALFFGYENVGDQFKAENKVDLVITGALDLSKEWDLSPVL